MYRDQMSVIVNEAKQTLAEDILKAGHRRLREQAVLIFKSKALG